MPFERAGDPARRDLLQNRAAADRLQMAAQERLGSRIGAGDKICFRTEGEGGSQERQRKCGAESVSELGWFH